MHLLLGVGPRVDSDNVLGERWGFSLGRPSQNSIL